MPAHNRSKNGLRNILPFLAALLTWLYAGGVLWYSVVQVGQLVQEARRREEQTWGQLKPIRYENLASLQLLRQNRLLSRVTSLAFSPSGRYLTAGSDAAQVVVFEVVSNRRVAHWAGAGFVLDVAFAPDEQVIASAHSDGFVRLWGLPESRLLRTLHGQAENVNALAFGAEGGLLASGSSDAAVLIWQWQAGRIQQSYTLNDVVTALAFSPDGRFLAAADAGGQIWLWQNLAHEPFCHWQHLGGVTDLRFGSDSGTLYSAGGASIASWNVNDCAASRLFPAPEGESVTKIALSPEGRLLAGTGGSWRRPKLWMWNLADGLLLLDASLPPAAESIRDVTFSPDGRVLLTASHDGLIRWWGVK